MFGVYHLQEQDWRSLWRSARELLSGSRGKLAIAVVSGSCGALATYLAANIWTHTENRWLATGSIAQGCATILAILLLGNQFLAGQREREEDKIERYLTALTSADPLERLIAIRSLAALDLPPERRERIEEFFRYLLSRESDRAARSALLDYFQSSEATMSLKPLSIPISVSAETEKSLNFCHEFSDRC